MEYRSISTHTIEGQTEAERLVANGWEVYRLGLFRVYLRKTEGPDTRRLRKQHADTVRLTSPD